MARRNFLSRRKAVSPTNQPQPGSGEGNPALSQNVMPNSVLAAVMQHVNSPSPSEGNETGDIPEQIMRRMGLPGQTPDNAAPRADDGIKDPNGPKNTAWGRGERVTVSNPDMRGFVDARLKEALDLTRTDPKQYLTIFKNTSSEYDEKLYNDLIASMEAVRNIAGGDDPATVKGMILPGYCERAKEAAISCLYRYGHQDVSGLEKYMENIQQVQSKLSEWQNSEGNVNFQGPGHDSVGENGGNELTVHKARGRGIGQRPTDKYFRPQADKVSGIQGVAGIESDGADSVKRETAFYLLSEYLQTGLSTPTREGTRQDGGKTVKGAVLNGAKGRTGFDFNYRYMGINDYGEKTPTQGEGAKPAHSGGELIYHRDDKQTLGERMEETGATLGVKTTSMAHQMGIVNGKSVKGGTLDTLDPRFLRDLNRLNLLDILAAHPDRHLGNLMIDTAKNGDYKSMSAIDNDAVFGSQKDKPLVTQAGTNRNNQTGIKAGMRMDKDLTDRIVNTKKEDIQRIFADYLAPKEIEALWTRFEGLSGIIRQNQELEKASGKQLFLSEKDWENGDMEQLVKEEMSLSKGAGFGAGQEAGNSYISRLMFTAQAWDEQERDVSNELSAQRTAAEDAPALDMDTDTEAEARNAFIVSANHISAFARKKLDEDENGRNLSEEQKKERVKTESERLRGLSNQYEARLEADIRLQGAEAVQARFDKMEGLTPEEREKAKNRVKETYKKIMREALKKSVHGAKGPLTATDSNNY